LKQKAASPITQRKSNAVASAKDSVLEEQQDRAPAGRMPSLLYVYSGRVGVEPTAYAYLWGKNLFVVIIL